MQHPSDGFPTGLYGSDPLAPASSGGGEQVGISEAVTEEDTKVIIPWQLSENMASLF